MSDIRIRSTGTRPKYDELEADLEAIKTAYSNAREKEEREAWDKYFAAFQPHLANASQCAEYADLMLEERRKRFPPAIAKQDAEPHGE